MTMGTTASLPDLITEAQTTEEAFLRQIFVRDQMAEWSKQPLVMARADGVYLLGRPGQALSRRDLGDLRRLGGPQQPPGDRGDHGSSSTSLAFSPPMHGTNPLAVQLANLLAELAPGDLSTVKFQMRRLGGRPRRPSSWPGSITS